MTGKVMTPEEVDALDTSLTISFMEVERLIATVRKHEAEIERLDRIKEIVSNEDFDCAAALVRANDDCEQTQTELEQAEAARDRLRVELDRINERKFPIMNGRDIPWRLIEPYERQAQINHGQSLERLAERGGLSECEAVAIFESRRWHKMKTKEARAAIEALTPTDNADAE